MSHVFIETGQSRAGGAETNYTLSKGNAMGKGQGVGVNALGCRRCTDQGTGMRRWIGAS